VVAPAEQNPVPRVWALGRRGQKGLLGHGQHSLPPWQIGVLVTRTRLAYVRGSSPLLAATVVAQGALFGLRLFLVRYLTKSDYGAFATCFPSCLLLRRWRRSSCQ
jgi:hypothetical protein